MTKEEFIEQYELEDSVVLLEPWDEFSGGIVGVTEDRCHVIYGYNALVESLSKAWNSDPQDAIEWIDFNTIRQLPYMPESTRPIIMEEINDL